MKNITIEIPEEVFNKARIDLKSASEEVRRLIALELYRERKISMSRAAEIAGMPLSEFLSLSSSKEIPIYYTVEDLERDREIAKKL